MFSCFCFLGFGERRLVAGPGDESEKFDKRRRPAERIAPGQAGRRRTKARSLKRRREKEGTKRRGSTWSLRPKQALAAQEEQDVAQAVAAELKDGEPEERRTGGRAFFFGARRTRSKP